MILNDEKTEKKKTLFKWHHYWNVLFLTKYIKMVNRCHKILTSVCYLYIIEMSVKKASIIKQLNKIITFFSYIKVFLILNLRK